MCNCKKKTSMKVTKKEIAKNEEIERLQVELADHYNHIDKVIINEPVVVVKLKDGRKGVAKVGHSDTFNPETGFWCAYSKALKQGSPLSLGYSGIDWGKQTGNYSTSVFYYDAQNNTSPPLIGPPLIGQIKSRS